MKLNEAIKKSPYLRATRKGYEGKLEVHHSEDLYTTVQEFRKMNCNTDRLLKDSGWEPIMEVEHLITGLLDVA